MKLISLILSLLVSVTALAAPKYKSVEKLVVAAGTRMPLAAVETYSSHIVIQAKSTNTGSVYVGDVTVAAANGYVLAPGKEILLGGLVRNPGSNEAINLADVYIDAATSGEGVRVIYVYGRYKGKEPSVQ